MKEYIDVYFKNCDIITPTITMKGAITADTVQQLNLLVGVLKK